MVIISRVEMSPEIYGVDIKQVKNTIKILERTFKTEKIPYKSTSLEDLQAYFSIPTTTGDTTTLGQVFRKKWLLAHEMLEISELKFKGLFLVEDIFEKHYHEVLEAHYFATKWELYLAKKAGDDKWIQRRLRLFEMWKEDPNISEDLRIKYFNLFRQYSTEL